MSQIYALLNDVKTDIDLYDREDLTDIEIQKMKQLFRRVHKSKRFSGVTATVACAAIAVLMIGNTAFADEMHVAAKSIGWQIENFLGIDKDLQDYVTVLNTSQTDKGYTITLNEVILNENELVVSSTIKSEKPLDDAGLMTFADVYVDGRDVSGASGGCSKMLDDYTMEEVTNYDLKNVDTNGKLDFEIEYSQIGIKGNEINGNWDFRFLADGKALAANTKHIPLDASFQLPNGATIQLNELTSNNLGNKIYFTIPGLLKTKGAEYDIELKGSDDLGNQVEFYLSSVNGVEGKGCFKQDGEINETAKRITLKPYAVKYPEKSGRLSNDFQPVGKEFTIELINTSK